MPAKLGIALSVRVGSLAASVHADLAGPSACKDSLVVAVEVTGANALTCDSTALVVVD